METAKNLEKITQDIWPDIKKTVQTFLLKKRTAFTLIELMVVITIIGVLSTMVLVSLEEARGKARDARREADIRQIILAMEMGFSDTEKYVQAANTPIKIPCQNPPNCTTPGDGRYLDPVPQDPKEGKYLWRDNSPGAFFITGCDDQHYCIYVPLESQVGGKNWWFAGSHKGTLKLDVEPGSGNKCCW